LTVVGDLQLCRWDVPARLIEASVVEPVDVFQCPDSDVFDDLPASSWFDQFGLVEADHGMGQGVVGVVGVAIDGGDYL
jgi:hypothetical protein